jgi:hypothetical protein
MLLPQLQPHGLLVVARDGDGNLLCWWTKYISLCDPLIVETYEVI